MCELKGLRITGIVFASLATLVAMGSEGFYIWKAVEVSQCTGTNSSAIGNYDPCQDSRNDSDVCYYDELEVRSYVGIAEGIVGMITGICLINGFIFVIVPLMWVWVVWALGITAYNAYCIYDYFTTAQDLSVDCVDDSEFWDVFIDLDYAHFFIMVTTALCGYGLAFCVIIPVAGVITRMVGPNSATMGTYELQERTNG